MVSRKSVSAETARLGSRRLAFRLPALRRASTLGGAALIAALSSPSGAQAQCTDNFNYAAGNVPGVGQISPLSVGLPLGTGSSLSALISTINTVNTAFLTTTSSFVSAPGGPRPDQQGGGAWSRIIAGTVDTDNTSTGTLFAAPGFPAATGTQTCHTTTRQDYWGTQVGRDISILNSGGSGLNWHVGATAGYFEVKSKDITPGGSFTNPVNFPGITFTTPAGSFTADTEVPFAGIYTAITMGGFFFDAQARWDYYQNSLSDTNNGLLGQRLNAHGFSVTGNAGYQVRLPSNWFIEPSAGVVWSQVKIDPLLVPGLQQIGGIPGVGYARGAVVVDDVESLLGRATLRIGTNLTAGGVAWQPFATASVFHEFQGDVTATSVALFNGTGFDGFALQLKSTGGVGTYGQFAVGTAFQVLNTNWLGYGRVDYRTGENVEGISVNAGLRYQFAPSQAERAGLKDAPLARGGRPYNWAGLYAGGFSGVAWGKEEWSSAASPLTVAPEFAGYLIGGQAGYNIQSGRWVYGIEADLGASNAKGGRACPFNFFFTCEAELGWLGSLTGRVGYTWERALFYAKGGLAIGEVTAAGFPNPGPAAVLPIVVTSGTDTQTGWTIGGGMEFALTDKWSAKAEYMYYDLGSATHVLDNTPAGTVDVDTHGSTVRIGVNYHFGR